MPLKKIYNGTLYPATQNTVTAESDLSKRQFGWEKFGCSAKTVCRKTVATSV